MITKFKIFESKNQSYLIYPLGKFDVNKILSIRISYFSFKNNDINPKIFTLNHRELYNFSSNLSRNNDLVFKLDNIRNVDKSIYNISYIVDEEECKRILDQEIEIEDLELFINSKKFNI